VRRLPPASSVWRLSRAHLCALATGAAARAVGCSHSQPQGALPLVARRWGDDLGEAAPTPRELHREPQPVRRRAPPPWPRARDGDRSSTRAGVAMSSGCRGRRRRAELRASRDPDAVGCAQEEWGGDAVKSGNQRWEEIKMKKVGPAVWSSVRSVRMSVGEHFRTFFKKRKRSTPPSQNKCMV
jgi:hypothetical protein